MHKDRRWTKIWVMIVGATIISIKTAYADPLTYLRCWKDILNNAAQDESAETSPQDATNDSSEPPDGFLPAASNLICETGTNAVTPNLGIQFKGAGGTGGVPDTMGAIGPHHYFEVIQSDVAIFDRQSGLKISSVPFSKFFIGGSGDPRVLFDQHSGRWIVTAFQNDIIKLAVSTSSNPLGCWFQVNIDADVSMDFPTLGVDKNGIYVSVFVPSGNETDRLWVFEKAPLIDSPPTLGAFRMLSGSSYRNIHQPAHTYGENVPEYFVRAEPNLVIHKITGSVTNPRLEQVGTITAEDLAISIPDAPQLGTSKLIQTNDQRAQMAVFRKDVDGGTLWTCHNVSYQGRTACRWYEVDPVSLTILQCGTVSHPSLFLYYPSIMVNKNGDAAMAFSGSDANSYVGTYYTGRRKSDPPGHMGPIQTLRAGDGPYINGTSPSPLRWGDYSYTTLDPIDEVTFWTVQQFATSNSAAWSTWIAALRFEDFDCNENGRLDDEDVAAGCTVDCSQDCDDNQVPDECEPDCDIDGIPNRCEIESGDGDTDIDGIPNACEPWSDCNLNDVEDANEIAACSGAPFCSDCNGNGVLDGCDLGIAEYSGSSPDCNHNDIPDECDIMELRSSDCNSNSIPDECDGIRYVDGAATGANNGQTWFDAYDDLQLALDEVGNAGIAIQEIYVSAGIYRPTAGTDRTVAFELPPSVKLLGGFPAAGSCRIRNSRLYETVLTGDIGVQGSPADNSFHVLRGSNSDSGTLVDGFTIVGGNADAPDLPEYRSGGALYNLSGTPTLRHCFFFGNFAADFGGAIFASLPLKLDRCSFANNSSELGGGAVWGEIDAATDCVFYANSTGGDGGALFTNRRDPYIFQCRFSGNTALRGGGFFNLNSSPAILNCTFTANSASGGRGLYVSGLGSTEVLNSIFWDGGSEVGSDGALLSVTFSDVQGGWPGEGNLDADPLFLAPGTGPDDGPFGDSTSQLGSVNHRVQPNSPVIDAGQPNSFFEPGAPDHDGHGRVLCEIVDMGIYEFGIGDFNCDRVVTLSDFSAFFDCQATPSTLGCEALDFNADGDFTIDDYAGFQNALSGPK